MNLSDILAAVSRYYAIPEHDIRSRVKFRERVMVRGVYFHLARTVTRKPYRQIGCMIWDGMDHTTVLLGIRSIRKRMSDDKQLERDCVAILAASEPRGMPQEWVTKRAR